MLKIILALMLLLGTPALAQKAKAPGLSPDKAADQVVWIDEHARWNSEHMAAARRLEAVVKALKDHNTGFDIHGAELRAHGTEGDAAGVIAAHPRLRTAHEQARNVHHDLMDAVDTLTRVMRKNLGQNQSFPDTREPE